MTASRLLSHPSIALPLLLGQVLAARALDTPLDLTTLIGVQLFGLFDQLYIVYANDVADESTDRDNTTFTPFSGGSRVLVERRLTRDELFLGAVASMTVCFVISAALALVRGSPALVGLVVAAAILLWAYSYPPVRLSYRGGGELLQSVGLSVVLPLYGWCAQRGSIDGFPWAVSAVLLPSQIGCAISTSLPDEPSDRSSAKRTAAVRLGGEAAARLVGVLGVLAVGIAWVVLGARSPRLAWTLLVPLALSVGVFALRGTPPGSRRLSARVALGIASTLALECVLLAFAR